MVMNDEGQDRGLVLPHDEEAERSLLGAMLLSPVARETGLELVLPSDFMRPSNGQVFGAIASLHARGAPADAVSVNDELRRLGHNENGALVEMMSEVGSTLHAAHYADIVVRLAASRRVMQLLSEGLREAASRVDPWEIIERLTGNLASLDAPVLSAAQEAETLDEIIATAESSSPWVIPGMMRIDWRCVWVAPEGHGKSTVFRQIAALAAQGVHPFRFQTRFAPIRTLSVDLENPRGAIAETGGRIVGQLRRSLGDAYDPDRYRVYRRPDGMNLRLRPDRAHLEREIALHQPKLVCIGPANEMFDKLPGESWEDCTQPVLRYLKDLRMRFGFALFVEHHAPHGHAGYRELRPEGSSRWLKWPELGVSMAPDKEQKGYYHLGRFRGDRLSFHDWPRGLVRGREYPFDGVYPKREEAPPPDAPPPGDDGGRF